MDIGLLFKRVTEWSRLLPLGRLSESSGLKKISACPGWLGLSADRTSFVFLPDRAEIVQKVFELSIGGVGSYRTANYLNQQNVPAFGPSPTWDHSTFVALLPSRATI